MMATTYSHPDGHGIVLGDDLMTACSSEGATVSPSIGPDALPALGAALIEHSIADDASERAGAALGGELLNELLALRDHPQAEAFRALRDKLYALGKLEHFDSAAGGFAVAVVSVLEVGVANLPKFEGVHE